MVTLLFTAIFIIGLLAVSLYFWAPRAKNAEPGLLPPPPDSHRGLFGDHDGFDSAVSSPLTSTNGLELQRASLIERALGGDKSSLREAHALGNPKVYNQVLERLVANADRYPKLLALASFVTNEELPVTLTLAEAVVAAWKKSPDRSSTAIALHFAALTDDPALFTRTVETALQLWHQQSLADVSSAELRALFDGEFWLLSEQSRGSGAGFVLKRVLANARRELETAQRVH